MTWVAPLLEAQRCGLMQADEVWETIFGCWSLDDPSVVVRHVIQAWPSLLRGPEPVQAHPDQEPIVVLDELEVQPGRA